MRPRPRDGRTRLAVAGAGAAIIALTLLMAAGAPEGLAYLAPALAVTSMLLLGGYPGERVLLRAASAPRAAAGGRPLDSPCLSVYTRCGRSGRLLAAALAGRAPPAAALR